MGGVRGLYNVFRDSAMGFHALHKNPMLTVQPFSSIGYLISLTVYDSRSRSGQRVGRGITTGVGLSNNFTI
jgi:hypothetical protein